MRSKKRNKNIKLLQHIRNIKRDNNINKNHPYWTGDWIWAWNHPIIFGNGLFEDNIYLTHNKSEWNIGIYNRE